MAKKKVLAKGNEEKGEDARKVVFQMRMDGELHRKLTVAAEAAGMSLNQLIHGMCEGCAGRLIVGDKTETAGRIGVTSVKGCVFFGRVAVRLSGRELQEFLTDHDGEEPDEDNGEYWFRIDHSNRSVVRY